MHAGETLVARWLERRGLAYEFEPDGDVSTQPDFRVGSARGQVAVEVESIESWGGFEALFRGLDEQAASAPIAPGRILVGGGFSRGMDEALRPLPK